MKDCRIRNEMKQQLHRIEPVEADCVIAIRKRARIGGLGLRASAPHFLERKNYARVPQRFAPLGEQGPRGKRRSGALHPC